MTVVRRIVRLLENPPKPLTPRQRAQRRYQQSAKGRAAAKRGKTRRLKSLRASIVDGARVTRWKNANRPHVMVYNRVYLRRRRREQRQEARA